MNTLNTQAERELYENWQQTEGKQMNDGITMFDVWLAARRASVAAEPEDPSVGKKMLIEALNATGRMPLGQLMARAATRIKQLESQPVLGDVVEPTQRDPLSGCGRRGGSCICDGDECRKDDAPASVGGPDLSKLKEHCIEHKGKRRFFYECCDVERILATKPAQGEVAK